MEIGKVPESVLKRSIFKQIHTKRPEVLVGAGVGEDCAAMELAPGEVFVFSTDPITGMVICFLISLIASAASLVGTVQRMISQPASLTLLRKN